MAMMTALFIACYNAAFRIEHLNLFFLLGGAQNVLTITFVVHCSGPTRRLEEIWRKRRLRILSRPYNRLRLSQSFTSLISASCCCGSGDVVCSRSLVWCKESARARSLSRTDAELHPWASGGERRKYLLVEQIKSTGHKTIERVLKW